MVRWNLASAHPGRMVQLGLLGKKISKKFSAISDGKIRLQFFQPKALAPPLQYFDAIAKGAIDAAYTTPGYWYGKEKALVMFSSIPFDRRRAKISPGAIMAAANRSWTVSIRIMG